MIFSISGAESLYRFNAMEYYTATEYKQATTNNMDYSHQRRAKRSRNTCTLMDIKRSKPWKPNLWD